MRIVIILAHLLEQRYWGIWFVTTISHQFHRINIVKLIRESGKTFRCSQVDQLVYPGAYLINEIEDSQFILSTIKTNLTNNHSQKSNELSSDGISAKTVKKTNDIRKKIITGLSGRIRSRTPCINTVLYLGKEQNMALESTGTTPSYGSFIDSIDINSMATNKRIQDS